MIGGGAARDESVRRSTRAIAATARSASSTVEHERRAEPQRRRRHGVHEHVLLVQQPARDARRVAARELDREQQPEAAHARHAGHAGEPLAQVRADPLGVAEQVLGLDRVEHRQRGGRDRRRGAERRGVLARREPVLERPRHERADRDAATPSPFASVTASG